MIYIRKRRTPAEIEEKAEKLKRHREVHMKNLACRKIQIN